MQVKRAWSEQILSHDWGVEISVRVWARRRYATMPTPKKLSVMYNDKEIVQKATREMTWQDVAADFESGLEVRSVQSACVRILLVHLTGHHCCRRSVCIA